MEGGTDENQEGRGSGFVISKDGLAVTNNHVVTGATKISVLVPGKTDPVPAKVLGASECADLAVIDLDGGGYDALSWAKEAPDIGDEVQAVGSVVTTKAELVALLQSLLTFEFDPAAFEKWKAEHPT